MAGPDPLTQLEAIIAAEIGRLEVRRGEIARASEAVAVLRLDRAPDRPGSQGFEHVAPDLAGPVIERMLETTTDVVRSSIQTLDVGPGLGDANVELCRRRMRDGLEQRAIYPAATLETTAGRQWIREFAAAGEIQRVHPGPPTDAVIFGRECVLTVTPWGRPESTYVIVREPVLIDVFIAWFDGMWQVAVDLGSTGDAVAPPLDDRLIRLLSLGVKDEAIARALGVGLRTVRRRVAALMDEHGVSTRFQLGAALHRAGRLSSQDFFG